MGINECFVPPLSVDYQRRLSYKKMMKQSVPTLLLLLLGLIVQDAAFSASSTPAVTWAAQGLPPGLSINASTGAITGKPTVAGNYTVIIYPKNGSAVGNMNSIKITVLPAGVNLPTYYSYNRLTSQGNYLGGIISGAGGYIYAFDSVLNSPVFTTNGTSFVSPSLPPSLSASVYWSGQILASTTNKTAFIAVDQNNASHFLVANDGAAFYDSIFPSTNRGNAVVTGDNYGNFYLLTIDGKLWKTASRSISWSNIGILPANMITSYNNEVANYVFTGMSVAGNNANYVIAVQGYQGTSVLFNSINNGSLTQNANTQISCVAYGNGIYLGTGPTGTGVFSSTDGQNWTQISSVDPGNIIYSSYEKLFFSSSGGVSADGVYWQSYQSYYYGGQLASSGTGLVFLGGAQLSTNNIPNGASGTFQTSVGKSTTITAAH